MLRVYIYTCISWYIYIYVNKYYLKGFQDNREQVAHNTPLENRSIWNNIFCNEEAIQDSNQPFPDDISVYFT